MASILNLYRSLKKNDIDPKTAKAIVGGDEKTNDVSVLIDSIQRIDENISDVGLKSEIVMACACCITERFGRNMVQYGIENKDLPLSEKVAGIVNVPGPYKQDIHYDTWGTPVLYDDGTLTTGIIRVWKTEQGFKCPCPTLKDYTYDMPISFTYCMCCAGFYRYHYQNALNIKLKLIPERCTSALESAGTRPCSFSFKIAD